MKSEIEMLDMLDSHAVNVLEIYRQGIITGNATFQTEIPSWQEWSSSHLDSCRIVAKSDGIPVGWAALSKVSGRCVYSGVAEVSVYIGDEFRGRGVGTILLAELIRKSENQGIWTLQAGIFPENESSISLHLKNGFRVVGRREKLGKLKGIWRDVMLLERRSKTT